MILLKFSANEVKKSALLEPFTFDETVDVTELEKWQDNDIRKIGSVQVKGICTVEKDEILFSFSINGTMILPCARTLVDVPYNFQFHATEIFSTSSTNRGDDEEIHPIIEDTIDLKPFILESIILQMPYRVFSDKKGLEQGDGWSLYSEEKLAEENKDKIDPRMQKLQQLLNENNKK